MTRTMQCILLSIAMAATAPLHAQDFKAHGYLDLRAVAAPGELAWHEGGTGKTRFGRGDDGFFATGLLSLGWQATPSLYASADVQLLPEQRRDVDVLHAYVRWRPISTTPWRVSVKAGAFYPPVSMENEGVGWTSLWTLTPSAINSWVGEELRTIGLEANLEHRGETGTFEAGAAVFRWNDPAGELLAARGWAMNDLTSGLRTVLREPDVHVALYGIEPPLLYEPFAETDKRIGWYAHARWHTAYGSELRALYYDNRTEPDSFDIYGNRPIFGWHTRFWSLGARHETGDWTLMAQAMAGSTGFEPAKDLFLATHFKAGFLMVAHRLGDWQPALRIDLFQSDQRPGRLAVPLDEHGNAFTAALNWRPRPTLRVTGEWLRIDSSRNQRRLAGLAARSVEQQLQLSVRLLF